MLAARCSINLAISDTSLAPRVLAEPFKAQASISINSRSLPSANCRNSARRASVSRANTAKVSRTPSSPIAAVRCASAVRSSTAGTAGDSESTAVAAACREGPQHGGDHGRLAQRLGEEIGHPGIAAQLDIFGECIRGQRDDGQAREPAAMGADRSCCRQTIHLRHPHIHQHQVVVGLRCRLHRLHAVGRDPRLRVELPQHHEHHHPVGGVILGDQHPQRAAQRGDARLQVVGADAVGALVPHHPVARWQRQAEPECRPLALPRR